jgi:DNA polymerase III subunit alpha
MAAKFAHLHLHTEYSLLDGLSNVKKLTKKVKEMGMDSVAITDHGVMYGAIEFYKACAKEEVKPIVGLEAYTTNKDHKIKNEDGSRGADAFHLLLLAKDEEGYRNLMKLTSIAHTEGYYYRPRFDKKTLEKYSKGLICTSACPASELADAILEKGYDKAKEVATYFQQLFGKDYYLEVQNHEYESAILTAQTPEIRDEMQKMSGYEKSINEAVLKLSRELAIPIIATNDAHYINQEDAEAQDVLVCVATGKQVTDTKRIRFIDNPNFYVKSPDEMAALFPTLPEALDNTVKIAEQCNLEISTFGKWFFPEFPTEKGETPEDMLKRLAYERLPERVPGYDEEVTKRLDYELDIICSKGYAPYFLITQDFVYWANEKGIITNTRGSAAGSLASFVLGITTVNPLTYYLPFERFLNPYRPSPPDIDFDVADNRREDIINYIADKYGRDKVAQICTFGRMLARAAIRDVSRVLGYPYAVGDRLSKVTPPPKQGFPVDIPKALIESPELKQLYDTDPDSKKILDLAHQVEGSARHISVHAAGVVVSKTAMTDYAPLQLETGGSKVITQYEFHACEEVGLIKFDILGIRNLSILGSAVEIVEASRGIKVDLKKIPLDDAKTYEMLGRGETMGVFQLGGSGMTRYLKELKPTKITDLMAMVALFRPGPMSVIPEYIARKHDPKLISYLDPRMEKFLEASYGLIVYQDDLLFCALDLAGYTWEEADKFRKAVGKKIPEEMAAQKEKFTTGIVANGQTQEFADNLWKLFEPFQSYGFNKAHAASYGMISYQTAYMKANYPVEYMCALMTAEAGDTDKVAAALAECRRMKINVLPPDINESETGFKIVNDPESLDGRAIRFGFSAIKNVGAAAIESILNARSEGSFASLTDMFRKTDNQKVNKRVIESLVKAGALDRFGKRAAVLAAIDIIRGKAMDAQKKSQNGQEDLFSQDEEVKAEALLVVDTLPDIDDFSQEEKLEQERELLGFYVTENPISNSMAQIAGYISNKIIELSSEELIGQKVKIGGVVATMRNVVTKNGGKEMAFVSLEDDTGKVDMVVFPSIYANTKSYWGTRQPLVIDGKVEYREDSVSLIVEDVKTLADLSPNSDRQYEPEDGEVVLRIPRGTDPKAMVQINQLLQGHKGDQTLIVLVENGFGDKKITLPYGISWTRELQDKVKNLLTN